MINNYFAFMPFSTFSWYTGNVCTFCSGTGNDALLFYQYIITTAYLANRKNASIRNHCLWWMSKVVKFKQQQWLFVAPQKAKFLWYSNPPSATSVPTLCIICKLVLVINTVKILFTWHYTTINHVWNSLTYPCGTSNDAPKQILFVTDCCFKISA